MSLSGLVALIGMVVATVAFAVADYLNFTAAMWIIAIGILLFGAAEFGRSLRKHADFDHDWNGQ